MTAPSAYYTFDEVAKNNGKNQSRAWIVVKDNVYDVTDYLSEHPGGGELIEEWIGMDGTKAFNDVGHSGDAKNTIKKFKIGEIVEEERKKNQRNGIQKQPTKDTSAIKPKRSIVNMVTCGLCG